MRIHYVLLVALLCSTSFTLSAQSNDFILNPSFEDTPGLNRAPKSWFNCGFDAESPVDVHGAETEFFGVKELAADGEAFLGMVTRDNGTYEGVSTKLKQPLQADSSYKLTILVNQAETYHSFSRTNDKPINFDSPVRLEIWGGPDYCSMTTLFEEYEIFEAGNWTEVTFYFTPDRSYKFLGLYARHIDEYAETNGNLLLDYVGIVKLGIADENE